jgi:hypothetical protein
MFTLKMISRNNWPLITTIEIWLDMTDIIIFLLAGVDNHRILA